MKNKSGNNIHKDLEPVEPLITDIFNPKHQFAPFLAQTRDELIKNPIGKYYCTCTNPDAPENPPVFPDDENKGWSCKDRFLDVFQLLSFLDPPRLEGCVRLLNNIDSRKGIKVGYKILNVLAEHIPRLRSFNSNKEHYKTVKAEAKKTLNKLRNAKNKFLKAWDGQFPADVLDGYSRTIDGWLLRSNAQSTIHTISLHYAVGWLPGMSGQPIHPKGMKLSNRFAKNEDVKRQMIIDLYNLIKEEKRSKAKIADDIQYLLNSFGEEDHAGSIKKYFPTT